MSQQTSHGRRRTAAGIARERRWRRALPMLVIGALSCSVTACSTRTSEHEFTPWFKVRTSYFKFGSFSETPDKRTYLARHFGFLWLPFDATGAVALSDAVVMVDQGAKGKSVLMRDAFDAAPVCPLNGRASVPPSTSTVDCVLVGADTEWTGPGHRTLTVRRTGFDGKPVYDKTIAVTDASHAFSDISFYDAAGTAYFLAVSTASINDKHVPPDCMLLRGFGQDTHVVARRPDITDFVQCVQPAAWKSQIGPNINHWDTITYPGSHRTPHW